MADYLLDGLPLPPPDRVTVTLTPLSRMDRAADGTLLMDCLPVKRVLSLGWNALRPAREEALRRALAAAPLLTLTLPAPPGEASSSVLCALTRYEASRGPSPAGAPLLWESVRAELTEA